MPAAAEASQLKRGEAGRAGGDVRSDVHVTVEERTSGGSRDRPAIAGCTRTTATTSASRCAMCCTRSVSNTPSSAWWTKARCRSSSLRESKQRYGALVSGRQTSALPDAIPLPASSARDRLRRSRLYLPGNEPKYFVNAGLHGPDAVILDLEDSVHHAEKDAARLLVRNALARRRFRRRRAHGAHQPVAARPRRSGRDRAASRPTSS